MLSRTLLSWSHAALILFGAGSFLVTQHAMAQAWPYKPIKIIVPYVPGGGTDLTARVVGRAAGELLGQSVVVENKPGANTILSTQFVQRSEPDGYTLLIAAAPFTLNTALGAQLPYHPLRDFVPVINLVDMPMLVVVHPSVAARDMKELLAQIRSKQVPRFYGTAGAGSMPYMFGEAFWSAAGEQLDHVGYKGAGQMVQDLVAGQIKLGVDVYASSGALIKSGKLRALATNAMQRSPLLPDVPTLAEQGVPQIAGSVNFGLVAPSGTPPHVIEKLNTAFHQALQKPDVRKQLEAAGLLVIGGAPKDYAAFLEADIKTWAKVAREKNIKPN